MLTQEKSLAARSGLPDGLAYLLASYPQSGWRSHGNFGQLAGFWLHVHGGLKSGGAAVVETVSRFRQRPEGPDDFQRTLVPQLNSFLQGLEHHHRIEDDIYFPKFRRLDTRMVAGFELLEADHVVIHEHLLTTVASARKLLLSLGAPHDDSRRDLDVFATDAEATLAVVLRHLADEEDLVIPALLEHGERPLRG